MSTESNNATDLTIIEVPRPGDGIVGLGRRPPVRASSVPAVAVVAKAPEPKRAEPSEARMRRYLPVVRELFPLPSPESEPVEPRTVKDGRVRARTISIKRLSKRELERGRMLYPDVDVERPVTRGDCLHGPQSERPCPFVSCKHHLFLDVNDRTGSIKLNFPDREVWELPETCALDIADRGGITLEEVGAIMNLTRERVRQLETRGLAKLQGLPEIASLSDYCDDEPGSATLERGRVVGTGVAYSRRTIAGGTW